MDKKYFKGNLARNITFGLSWLLQAVLGCGWIAAIVLLIVDKEVLELEDKRELVSIIVSAAITVVLHVLFILIITEIANFALFVCVVIACVKAFMGKSFQIPGVYHIAKAIIK